MGVSISPFDLYLGDISTLQGYRCRTFSRDSAPLVAPKFSTGAQGQTDLDLLKSVSVDNIAGGMFQRDFEDPQKVARAVGFYNRYDNNLYPTPNMPAFTAFLPTTSYKITAMCSSELYTFVAVSYTAAGNVNNKLFRLNKGTNTWTDLTAGMPAIIRAGTTGSGLGAPICDLGLHKNYLYVSGQTGIPALGTWFPNYRYDLTAGTWQNLSGFGVLMRTMRGILYHINTSSMIYAMSNETAAGSATYTLIDIAGFSDVVNATPTDAKEFNGALWIGKPDGLYRFDGLKATMILPLASRYLTVYNGALYFAAGQWLYSFNGAQVVKLQYFGGSESITGISATIDHLLVCTKVNTAGSYADADKPSIVYAGKSQIRTYTYDGVGFYIVDERLVTDVGGGQAWPTYNGNKLITMWSDGSVNNAWWIDLSTAGSAAAVATTSQLEITVSEHDDGYPNIFKSLELIEANYAGIVAGDTIDVTYQLYDGKVWGSWLTAGQVTSTSGNNFEITNLSNKLYKRIRVNLKATLTAASTLSLKGASIRYTLQPRARWRWQTTLMAQGKDRNGNTITDDPNALTNTITKAIKQKTPVFMLSPDFGVVKAQIAAGVLTFIVKGQQPLYADPYAEYQLVAVKNNNSVWEVLRVSSVSYASGPDETTITVKERGYYGVTAAQINAGAEFHLCYKVYVTRLLREAPTLDLNTYNEQDTSGESQLKREFLLEITEV